MKYLELKQNGYKLVKTSLNRGYISRKTKEEDIECSTYNGKYGNGYKVCKPNYESTNYMIVEYWTK